MPEVTTPRGLVVLCNCLAHQKRRGCSWLRSSCSWYSTQRTGASTRGWCQAIDIPVEGNARSNWSTEI